MAQKFKSGQIVYIANGDEILKGKALSKDSKKNIEDLHVYKGETLIEYETPSGKEVFSFLNENIFKSKELAVKSLLKDFEHLLKEDQERVLSRHEELLDFKNRYKEFIDASN